MFPTLYVDAHGDPCSDSGNGEWTGRSWNFNTVPIEYAPATSASKGTQTEELEAFARLEEPDLLQVEAHNIASQKHEEFIAQLLQDDKDMRTALKQKNKREKRK